MTASFHVRLRLLLLAVSVIAACSAAPSQIWTKQISEPQAVPAPTQLLQQLMPVRRDGKPCESKDRRDAQLSALAALGITSRGVVDARLLLEDLDGDDVPEALLSIRFEPSNVLLFVLKRDGDQWYRLSSPPELSCWCRYGDSPLGTFAEIRSWGQQSFQPFRLIFVRGSGGGTGLCERSVSVLALHDFELRGLFNSTEERHEC